MTIQTFGHYPKQTVDGKSWKESWAGWKPADSWPTIKDKQFRWRGDLALSMWIAYGMCAPALCRRYFFVVVCIWVHSRKSRARPTVGHNKQVKGRRLHAIMDKLWNRAERKFGPVIALLGVAGKVEYNQLFRLHFCRSAHLKHAGHWSSICGSALRSLGLLPWGEERYAMNFKTVVKKFEYPR